MKIFLFIILLIVIGLPIYFMVLFYNHFKKYVKVKFTFNKKSKTSNPKVDIKTLLSQITKKN